MSHKPISKNRRDHYLPQSYLRGFIDPSRAKESKPLWCYQLHNKRWKERAPKEIGYIDGFYDYAIEVTNAEHPDTTFKYLENNFSHVRAQILTDKFSWPKHKDFLLRYMQMIRARSPLFFDQWREQAKSIRIARIVEVLSEKSVKVDNAEGTPMTQAEVQNWTISQMREEIKKGPDWMTNFHWALRYTETPNDPVITGEQPLSFIGNKAGIRAGLEDPDTLICFPICWQACLLGSIRRFDVETEQFYPATLRNFRKAYIENGRSFLVSPQKLTPDELV